MNSPHYEPKTKEPATKEPSSEDKTPPIVEKRNGFKDFFKKYGNFHEIVASAKKKLFIKKRKNRKKSLPAWLVFIFFVFCVAIYQYFSMGKRLNYSSITYLVCLVFAQYVVIKTIRIISETQISNPIVRFFRAEKILIKLQRLALWLNTIKRWQRVTIVLCVLSIGFILL